MLKWQNLDFVRLIIEVDGDSLHPFQVGLRSPFSACAVEGGLGYLQKHFYKTVGPEGFIFSQVSVSILI